MNGNNFRKEYKSLMEEITPDGGLLEHIAQLAKETSVLPAPKSFFIRHRAILTAAATFAVVIGIFAMGSVVVPHLNNMSLAPSSAAGNAPSCDNAGENGENIEHYNIEGNFSRDINLEPENNEHNSLINTDIPSMNIESSAFDGSHSEIADSIGSAVLPTPEEIYFDDGFLYELAEKAKNGTLTVEELGRNVTVQDSGSSCKAFFSFNRNGNSYTLTADFEDNDGELRVISLNITQ